MRIGRPGRRLTRRDALAGAVAVWLVPRCARPGEAAAEPWWHRFPSVAQVASPEAFRPTFARVAIFNAAADPTWGPYGQRLSLLDTRAAMAELRQRGARVITYIEGVGDCAVYVAAFVRCDDGSFLGRTDDPQTPVAVRTHWCWTAPQLPRGDVFGWVGVHAAAMQEPYTKPGFTLDAIGVRPPSYPDGRPATGVIGHRPEPINAQLWDACAAKDINGDLRPVFGPVVGVRAGDDPPAGCSEGLYRATVGKEEIDAAGLPAGTGVWCGHISIHKDLSAPFWRDYARASARAIAQADCDGVWCDNWSPWDNFGYPPVKHAFGDWSVVRFKEYLRREGPRDEVRLAGLASDDILAELRQRAATYGVRDCTNLSDAGWSDRRWLDDPLWRLYKVGRQVQARRDLRALHSAIRDGARRGGKSDFAVCGNDVPFYGLGWAREAWTDMVHTEVTPGWHMGSGSRGIMLPPAGKMAVVYKAALAHQSGRFCGAWYYLDQKAERYQRKPGLGRVLSAEAFASGAFLLCDPQLARVAGTVESHAWWNAFVREHEEWFGIRRPLADVGVVFSPDCQLAELTPGGYPDLDRQPHAFGHWGWGTALLDAHIPYVVVPDWRLTPTGLRGLRTLVVPDVQCLDDAQVDAITAWVRSGGRLVMTGKCGLRRGVSGAFALRARAALAEGLGVTELCTGTRVGRGSVTALEADLGMRYFLAAEERARMLPAIVSPLGDHALVETIGVPPTVEIGLWASADRGTVFLDLANTDIDLARDAARSITWLTVRLSRRLMRGVQWSAVSPDGLPSVDVHERGDCVEIQVGSLKHYTSIRIGPA